MVLGLLHMDRWTKIMKLIHPILQLSTVNMLNMKQGTVTFTRTQFLLTFLYKFYTVQSRSRFYILHISVTMQLHMQQALFIFKNSLPCGKFPIYGTTQHGRSRSGQQEIVSLLTSQKGIPGISLSGNCQCPCVQQPSTVVLMQLWMAYM